MIKTWATRDEWKIYSGCGDAGDEFVTNNDLPKAKKTCSRCMVRPECIQWALDPGTGRGLLPDDVDEYGQLKPHQAAEVVAAGVWIPEEDHPDYRVTLDKLALMLDNEFKLRGDV